MWGFGYVNICLLGLHMNLHCQCVFELREVAAVCVCIAEGWYGLREHRKDCNSTDVGKHGKYLYVSCHPEAPTGHTDKHSGNLLVVLWVYCICILQGMCARLK